MKYLLSHQQNKLNLLFIVVLLFYSNQINKKIHITILNSLFTFIKITLLSVKKKYPKTSVVWNEGFIAWEKYKKLCLTCHIALSHFLCTFL